MNQPNFAIYYVKDGYSTERKIMGRQSAGKAFMKGVARRWPSAELHGYGNGKTSGPTMLTQLRGDKFTGTLRWREAPGDAVLKELGAVYYPAPVTNALAHIRNAQGPSAFSLFGVTHTLSSAGAMDQVANYVLPPFKPWDALICTSTAALTVVSHLQEEIREWMSVHIGATRFNTPRMPVIPLGVDAPAFERTDEKIATARTALGLSSEETAFLFAGRLTFHAKANPAPLYRALEAASVRLGQNLVCIEAGLYPNQNVEQSFAKARQLIAPNVRFIHVDGNNEELYAQAWRASDVFVSLSDNIQETFGLTPLEAMAAGMPVIVSDWNGYKDTVRDGIDGYRIPVTLPPPGAGGDLAVRHAMETDTYDYFIGRTSMATAVDIAVLTDRIVTLTQDGALRRQLGEAGRQRAQSQYDWPVILDRYVDLVADLGELRRSAGPLPVEAWPLRPDPFALFRDYPSQTLTNSWRVMAVAEERSALEALLQLNMINYVVEPQTLPQNSILALHASAAAGDHTVGSLLASQGGDKPQTVRALMWLNKLGLVAFAP